MPRYIIIFFILFCLTSVSFFGVFLGDADVTVGTVASSGIFEYLTKPVAVHYEGTYNRTYVTYLNDDGEICVKYYDYGTETFSGEMVLYDGSDDDHCAPSLIVLDDGRIMVFYPSSHNGAIRCRRSVYPEDISSFSGAVTISSDSNNDYPNPIQASDGTLYCTYRGSPSDGPIVRSMSTNDGASWGSHTNLIQFSDGDSRSVYHMTYQKRGSNIIHIMTTDATVGDQNRQNIYYMRSTDGGSTWKKMSGTGVTLPGTKATMDLAWDSGPEDAIRQIDLCSDSNNYPHMLAYHNINTTEDIDSYLYHIWWDGDSWESENTTIGSPQFKFPSYVTGACFDTSDTDIIYASVTSGTRSNIEKWVKAQGVWSKAIDITTDVDTTDKIRPMPVNDHDGGFRVVWADGLYYPSGDPDDPLATNPSLKYTSWSTSVKYWGENTDGAGGGSDEDPPVINHMGYSGSGELGNESVMVGSFWINFTWNGGDSGSPVPDTYDIVFYNDPGCTDIYYNISGVNHDSYDHGDYVNYTVTIVSARVAEFYVRIKAYYE